MIKHEMKRLLTSKMLYLVIFVGILSGVFGLVSYYSDIYFMKQTGNGDAISAYEAWLYCLSIGGGSIYRMIMPLLVTIPYADSYLNDKKSGYLNFILTRTSYRNYLFSKIIIIVFGSIIVIGSILGGWWIIVNILFESSLPCNGVNYHPAGIFHNIYPKYPYFYILIITLSNIVIGIGYSLIGVGLSVFFKNRFMATAGPFSLYLGLMMVSLMLRIGVLNPTVMVCPYELAESNLLMLLVNFIVTYIIAYFLINNVKVKFYKEWIE